MYCSSFFFRFLNKTNLIILYYYKKKKYKNIKFGINITSMVEISNKIRYVTVNRVLSIYFNYKTMISV